MPSLQVITHAEKSSYRSGMVTTGQPFLVVLVFLSCLHLNILHDFLCVLISVLCLDVICFFQKRKEVYDERAPIRAPRDT